VGYAYIEEARAWVTGKRAAPPSRAEVMGD